MEGNNQGATASNVVEYDSLSDKSCIVADDSFEWVNCPAYIIGNPFYINVASVYTKVVSEIIKFLEHEFGMEFYRTRFGFLACEELSIYGACGSEVTKDGEPAIKYYINPISVDPDDPSLKSFERIYQTAKHEVAHAFYYMYDDERYAFENNDHGQEWISLCDVIDMEFYDKVSLKNKTWSST